MARAHVLHEVVGPHDEELQAFMGAGDLVGMQHTLWGLHHCPYRHRGRRARLVEQRHDVRDITRAFDLGNQDRVGP